MDWQTCAKVSKHIANTIATLHKAESYNDAKLLHLQQSLKTLFAQVESLSTSLPSCSISSATIKWHHGNSHLSGETSNSHQIRPKANENFVPQGYAQQDSFLVWSKNPAKAVKFQLKSRESHIATIANTQESLHQQWQKNTGGKFTSSRHQRSDNTCLICTNHWFS